ncbi:MAG: hypothetical protein HOW73_01190 [Polyangiaceae bacterium]|nr:hypothetical protein [Polyangiaceae bacterium]
MAQRVFLVRMQREALASAANAIRGTSADRRRLAVQLAAESAVHLRRVTVSERIGTAAEQTGRVPDAWGFARYCMPYLLASTLAKDICADLDALDPLRTPSELEAFFVAQAARLGMRVDKIDREAFIEPSAELVESWIAAQLDQAAALREKALRGTPEEVADYAVSTWIWLGRLFARTQPCFWQGRNRWLGGAAFPDEFSLETTVMTVGGSEPRTDLSPLVSTLQAQTRSQLASRTVYDLRPLLSSTADLTPSIAIDGWAEALPRSGGGNLASGAVTSDKLSQLVGVLLRGQTRGDLPYADGHEWAEIVIAASLTAQRVNAHLVEADDAIYGAYRWPAIDEDG